MFAIYSVFYQCDNRLFEHIVNSVAIGKMAGWTAVVHGPFCLCKEPIIFPDHNVIDRKTKFQFTSLFVDMFFFSFQTRMVKLIDLLIDRTKIWIFQDVLLTSCWLPNLYTVSLPCILYYFTPAFFCFVITNSHLLKESSCCLILHTAFNAQEAARVPLNCKRLAELW